MNSGVLQCKKCWKWEHIICYNFKDLRVGQEEEPCIRANTKELDRISSAN